MPNSGGGESSEGDEFYPASRTPSPRKKERRSSMEVFMDELEITEEDIVQAKRESGPYLGGIEESEEGVESELDGARLGSGRPRRGSRLHSGRDEGPERGKALWGRVSSQVNNRTNRNMMRNPKKSEIAAAKKRKASYYARCEEEGKSREEADLAWTEALDDDSTEMVDDLIDIAALEKIPRRKRTPDDMVKIVLLGKEFLVHRLTLHESESKVLKRLKPTRRCVHYMPSLSEQNGQQTYYLCQRPDAFESVIMYIEGGALHPPQKMGLDEFIDELVFYEIKNIDSAINAFHKKEESDSSTSEEEGFDGDVFPGLRMLRQRSHVEIKVMSRTEKFRKMVWKVTDGAAGDEWNKGEVDHDTTDRDVELAYLRASRIFDVVSFSILLVSVFIYCIETLPIYRLAQVLQCTDPSGNIIPESLDCIFPHNTTDHEFTFTIPDQGVFTGTLYKYGHSGDCICEHVEEATQHQGFWIAQIIFNSYFTLELLTRFICCPDKLDFMKQALNWVDFFAIVPYFVELGFSREASSNPITIFRILRLFRIVRIARLSKRFAGLRIFAMAVYKSKFILFQLFLFVLCLAIVFASMLFYTEYDVRRVDCYGTCFDSIPQSAWWSIVTMSTLGYGDMVPSTPLGKVIGSICSLCGILVLALPVPVFVENFQRLWDQHHLKERVRERRNRLKVDADKEKHASGHGFKSISENKLKQHMLQKRQSKLSNIDAVSGAGTLPGHSASMAELLKISDDPRKPIELISQMQTTSSTRSSWSSSLKSKLTWGKKRKKKMKAGDEEDDRDMTLSFPTRKPFKLTSTRLPTVTGHRENKVHPDSGHGPKRFSTHEFPDK